MNLVKDILQHTTDIGKHTESDLNYFPYYINYSALSLTFTSGPTYCDFLHFTWTSLITIFVNMIKITPLALACFDVFLQ